MRILRSKAVNSGRNAENASLRDDNYVRCAKCGFIAHLNRDQRASDGSRIGYGISYSENASGSGYWSGTDWTGPGYDFTITAGCPFCGTLLYDK